VTSLAWTALVVVCGSVWGGFAYLLTRAVRSERHKEKGRR
jgi:hypothetical protein